MHDSSRPRPATPPPAPDDTLHWPVVPGLLAALLALAALGAMAVSATVVIPVIVAVFVTLAVLPLDRAMAGWLPRGTTWLGRVIVMLILLAFLSLFLGGLAFSVSRIATQLPDVSGGIGSILPEPQADGRMAWLLGEARALLEGQTASLTARIIDVTTGLAQTIASAMGTALAGMVLVLFLILLALGEADTWEGKLDTLSTGTGASWREATRALGTALRRFLVTRAVVGVISTAAYTAWLAPFGIDLLLVWAILTFLMNFIPNIGAIVSGVVPTVYAFLTLDPASALLLGLGLAAIEQVIGNWLDPRL